MSDIPAATATPAARRSSAVHITLWVVQILLALFFILLGFNKLTGLQQMVDTFTTIGFGQWFRYLTGTVEIAGGLGLLIPRLSGLAALGLVGVMIGAVITHLTVLPPVSEALTPAVLGVVFGLIAWGRWPQTVALLGMLKR